MCYAALGGDPLVLAALIEQRADVNDSWFAFGGLVFSDFAFRVCG